MHIACLVACLAAFALVPIGPAQAVCGFGVGLGCAVTQRLLALASQAATDADRPRVIGQVIAAGLCGIVLARACIAVAAGTPVAHALLLLDAMVIAAAGAAAVIELASGADGLAAQPPAEMSAWTAWRRHPVLRAAALQLALVFALYNFAWISFTRADAAADVGAVPPAALFAAISACGAATALLTGRLCARHDPARLARLGAALLAGAALVGTLALTARHGWLAAMVLVDTGTQVVLVCNQARAQRLGRTAPMRGRLAAVVTTVGFIGGAAGASLVGVVPVQPHLSATETLSSAATHAPADRDSVSSSALYHRN